MVGSTSSLFLFLSALNNLDCDQLINLHHHHHHHHHHLSQMVCKSSVNNTEKPKKKHRKGLWSPEEDQRLRSYVLKHGHGCWSSVPINAGLQRNGKSCRLRWINYLRPGLKRGMFTPQEEETILALHRSLGNKWSQIALQLPGRTDNEVKNYWHSYLKKRIENAEEEKRTRVHQKNSEGWEHSLVSGEILTDCQNPGYDHSQSSPIDLPCHRSSLPRILFTEWLSLDNNAQGGIFADQSQGGSTNIALNCNSNLEDYMFGDLLLSDEMTFCGDYNSSELSEGSESDVIYSSQFDICGDFALSNDLIFM